MPQVVLITGCSTGIGRDLAQRLTQAGYVVAATARNPKTLDDLPAALKLPLDVTQAESVCGAVEATVQQLGRIDVLINNAGYALQGALEEIPVDDVRAMFDVNVYGVLRLIGTVAPHMRQQRSGRIINIGSIAGRLALPVNGTYSASKFALEALTDALRLELAPFGIAVVMVEPGPIKTRFDTTVKAHAKTILSNAGSPYYPLHRRSTQITTNMRHGEPGPEVVSRIVQQAIEAAQPRARYLAGVKPLNRLIFHLGVSVRDVIFKQLYQITASSR